MFSILHQPPNLLNICDPKMICLDINMPLVEASNAPFCVVYFYKCNYYENPDEKCKYQYNCII